MARFERGLLIIWISMASAWLGLLTVSFRLQSQHLTKIDVDYKLGLLATCWDLNQQDKLESNDTFRQLCDDTAVWAENHYYEVKTK